ncbi:capping protein inhibiting regulator of actin dynamics [Hemiscyllium ocellatum]|uniref:capping protein inhibiting regulator of actin dynamics n=1 Tax=Hemiscyllium ocellatum TaxID=170820 RepID=UPI002965E2AF|nr:capping protein inhibiting regulator of actin dynamics [Hemiscyllium ocellatum]
MGTRALSHDSIFIPEGSTGDGAMAEVTSQENFPGKVRTLQHQLAKDIKFGQHPLTLIGKRMEDTGANSEVDQFLRSPLEQAALQDTKLPASTPKAKSSALCVCVTIKTNQKLIMPDFSLRSDLFGNNITWDDNDIPLTMVQTPKSKRPPSGGTIESINLDAVPQSVRRLDNTAAKHKLSVKPRNQRISKKHGRLAQVHEMRSVTIHEFDFALEEKETIFVAKDLKYYKKEENEGQGETSHLKFGRERCRSEIMVHNRQEAELEGQKRWEEEQEETEEQVIQEEDRIHYEMEKPKLNEEELSGEEQKCVEFEEQKAHEKEQKYYEMEQQEIHEEEQRCDEMEKQKLYTENQKDHELEDQKLHEEAIGETEEYTLFEEEQNNEVKEQRLGEEEEKCELKENRLYQGEKRYDEMDKPKSDTEKQDHELMELEMKKEEQKCFEVEGLRKEDLHFHAAENNQPNEEPRKHNLEEQKEIERQHDLKKQQREEQSQKDAEPLNQEKQQFLEAQEEEQRRGELRWKEVDQRQTSSTPFSFQVSSGEKQIIFQKVNLTPVTHPREAVPSSDVNELQAFTKSNNGLSSSIYVPHTAILVTGAQLCGTAVDLKQIKDTACKTLLGFSEERKTIDLPPVEKPTKSNQGARSRIGKSKFNPEPSVEQARSTALTEWAAIRAKILKSSDERFQERRVHGRFSDDWTTFRSSSMHSSLRKTLSANAKFSITPAWQKWADGNKISNSEKMSISHKAEKQTTPEETVFAHICALESSEPCGLLTSENIGQDAAKDTQDDSHLDNHNIRTGDAAEGYKFAKDLPSFLVPSLPAVQRKEHSLLQAQPPVTNQTATNVITQTEGAMDTSPFGIKLRRTHYSLRFHYEQQGEQKRKKRYSAGDSMEGIPAFLASKEKEGESYTVSGKQFSYNKDNKVGNILKDSSNSISDISQTGITHLSSIDVAKHVKNKLAARSNEKVSSRPQPSQKPALAPKPTRFTPPPSPHNTLNKSADHKNTKNLLDSNVRKEDEKNDTSVQTYRVKNEEVETKDRKSFFPSINIPWRERADKKSDSIKKEKPVLQSRHSLDSSRLVDRVESSQPLWITLAMQKQKGFREQQASREERRQAREAKLAEKQTKENTIVSSSVDNKGGNHYMSTLQKSSQDEEKKIGNNIVSKVERRELLKKSSTLPNSVTVEICDSVGSSPQVKELPKRFSTPDAAPVSVEPAWLALAKRKAKAWSDCPQIIK